MKSEMNVGCLSRSWNIKGEMRMELDIVAP